MTIQALGVWAWGHELFRASLALPGSENSEWEGKQIDFWSQAGLAPHAVLDARRVGQLLLTSIQIRANFPIQMRIVCIDQHNAEAFVLLSGGATAAMHVDFGRSRQLIMNDVTHIAYVQSSGGDISGQQNAIVDFCKKNADRDLGRWGGGQGDDRSPSRIIPRIPFMPVHRVDPQNPLCLRSKVRGVDPKFLFRSKGQKNF